MDVRWRHREQLHFGTPWPRRYSASHTRDWQSLRRAWQLIQTTQRKQAPRPQRQRATRTLCSLPAAISIQPPALPCNTLQHTHTSLQHTVTHCNTLQHTVTRCNTLQYTATHCNTLQHTATHCNTISTPLHAGIHPGFPLRPSRRVS